MKPTRSDSAMFRLRVLFAFAIVSLGAAALLVRAVQLQWVDHGFLVSQGDARFQRVVTVPAHRGMILDRNEQPLAVSTPVDSVWANPHDLITVPEEWPKLAKQLKRNSADFGRRITSSQDRDFIYLARHLPPQEAQAVRQLGIPGVNLTREYRRYYPAGEVVGHVLGFTNIDDEGQEGAELAFDHWLAGEDGAKRVIQDRLGRKVQDVENIRTARPGRDLHLSIDMRIQYRAYRELKSAIQVNRAHSGSIVVIDVHTGEVLAMVNQPTFNPNDRGQIQASVYRNRAATDMLEPGSSIKPFVVAAALQSGRYDANSIIDTRPGFIQVGSKLIQDEHPQGAINIAMILAHSSNVGMTKIALSLQPQEIWSTMTKLGFGQVTSSGFPGESAGVFTHYSNWRPISVASQSYGYGLAVTPLQLAHAYATVGAGGIARPVSMLRVDAPVPGERVLDERNARTLVGMLESVVLQGGTGTRAAIRGYRVAGKTGTAWKATAGGYSTDRYVAVFGGVAPATRPRLAAVVVIDDPGAGRFYGGDVSAPVFSAVVGGALRMMGVEPDATKPANDRPAGEVPRVAQR
jgi:cell division protein FtsI (penicillin-binding protein 3)